MEWISTKIRFPKAGEEVLAACKNKNKEDGIWLYDLCSYYPDTGWEDRVNWEDVLCWTCIDEPKEDSVSEELDEAAKADAMIERPDDTEVGYDLNRYGGFISGAQWREEQMMAKAVDGVVHHFEKCGVASVHYTDPTGVPMAYFTSPEGLSAGDKVKIIVIKED